MTGLMLMNIRNCFELGSKGFENCFELGSKGFENCFELLKGSLMSTNHANHANRNIVIAWTDGACQGNHLRRGAKAGVGVWFGHNDKRNVSEPLEGTLQTNNRAELTGMIRAIEKTFENAKNGNDDKNGNKDLVVRTDSMYCKNGIEKWIINWKKNGWKNARKKPVKNKDLWMRLDELRNKYSVRFEWVKAHSGIEGNEYADQFAVDGINK